MFLYVLCARRPSTRRWPKTRNSAPSDSSLVSNRANGSSLILEFSSSWPARPLRFPPIHDIDTKRTTHRRNSRFCISLRYISPIGLSTFSMGSNGSCPCGSSGGRGKSPTVKTSIPSRTDQNLAQGRCRDDNLGPRSLKRLNQEIQPSIAATLPPNLGVKQCDQKRRVEHNRHSVRGSFLSTQAKRVAKGGITTPFSSFDGAELRHDVRQ